MIKNYSHIDGFTKESSPRLSYFLLGSYYNLNIFQIYYSISFMKTFCFVYNNIVTKGLPTLLISTLNIFKKENKNRFLQYYSFGKWTYGLFSNWIHCKSFLNISKYPFLNRKIKTMPKIIIALNNNFFLEKEVHNSFTSIVTFTLLNSNYASISRYFTPLNPLSFISINFYLKIFNSLYDRSFGIRLSFFWSFDFLNKIVCHKLTKKFLKIFKKGSFKFSFKKKKKSFRKLRYNKKRRVRRRRSLFHHDRVLEFFTDKRFFAKLYLKNEPRRKRNLRSIYFKRYSKLSKAKKKKKSINSLKKKINFISVYAKKNRVNLNFIFDYFKKFLKQIIQEKRADLFFKIFLSISNDVNNKDFLLKIKKLILLKVFLRNWRFFIINKY